MEQNKVSGQQPGQSQQAQQVQPAGGGITKDTYAFIVSEIQMGSNPASIPEKLVQKGIERDKASALTKAVLAQLVEAAQSEMLESSTIPRALLGGALAAIVGGLVWGLVAAATGYELGILAWGLGLVAGWAVLIFTGGKKGTVMQIIAVLSGLGGIFIGKYYTLYSVVKDVLTEDGNAEQLADFSLFSINFFVFFLSKLGEMLGGFDLLWVALAVATAWKIPKGLGITVPTHLLNRPMGS